MTYKITVKGLAWPTIDEGDDCIEILDIEDLKKLDGIDCGDNFAEYFYDETFRDCINHGFMSFQLEKDKLYTYTVYESSRELSSQELEKLKDYTVGQWSDGIGEGFEQQACTEINGKNVFISPGTISNELSINQTKN